MLAKLALLAAVDLPVGAEAVTGAVVPGVNGGADVLGYVDGPVLATEVVFAVWPGTNGAATPPAI
jgi:hypothetical protein